MLSLMITYFSTRWAVMVSWAISKEGCDLIKWNPSQLNQRSLRVGREGAAQLRAGYILLSPWPAWRDPGTRRNGREEWGCWTASLSFKRVGWKSRGIEEQTEVPQLPIPRLGYSSSHWQAEQGKQSKTDKVLAGSEAIAKLTVPPSSQVCGRGCPLLGTGESTVMPTWALTPGARSLAVWSWTFGVEFSGANQSQ